MLHLYDKEYLIHIGKCSDWKNIAKSLCVRDSQYTLFCSDDSMKERWRRNLQELLNTQHPCSLFYDPPPNLKIIVPITLNCLRRMKNGKAVGPDDISIKAWKSLDSLGVFTLTDLFNHIFNTGKIPHQWRLSFINPYLQGQGQCSR